MNHNRNKANIEVSNEKELLHSKIIRDADKADIIYMLVFENQETAWGSNTIEKEKITDEIYQEFIKEKAIDYQKRKTGVDILVSHFAYAFDFEYEYAIRTSKAKRIF